MNASRTARLIVTLKALLLAGLLLAGLLGAWGMPATATPPKIPMENTGVPGGGTITLGVEATPYAAPVRIEICPPCRTP